MYCCSTSNFITTLVVLVHVLGIPYIVLYLFFLFLAFGMQNKAYFNCFGVPPCMLTTVLSTYGTIGALICKHILFKYMTLNEQ